MYKYQFFYKYQSILKGDPKGYGFKMNFISFNLVVSTVLLITYAAVRAEMGLPGPKGEPGEFIIGPLGLPGIAGIKGEPGICAVGPKGDKGAKGAMGFIGKPGETGKVGYPGYPGMKGERGYPGLKGEWGIPGAPGAIGYPGYPGLKGEPGHTMNGPKGDRGVSGLNGQPGEKGDKGSCGCHDEFLNDIVHGDTDETAPTRDSSSWGTIENPGKTTCKHAPINESGTYYVYNSIEVVCDVDKKTTCVKIDANPLDVTTMNMKPFWLSSTGIDYRDIYNLSNTQLAWLQARSDTASINIRYHCVNTKPADKDAPVLLLSWNDVVIGPQSTLSSPFYYEVKNDGCSRVAEDMWGFTDIVIKNTSALRLPIIDFYVQDTKKDGQQHKISVTELCFH